jgi:alpha-glucuronidase
VHYAGFLVKADSEGNIGPQSYNCTEADGANLLARAVAPHGGIVMWRAFVYGVGSIATEDLAKQSFDTFMPLDGKFDDNVVLQIKNGPMDFQVREPLHPLLGGLKKTNVMIETQVTQEYTGQGIHVISLTQMWAYYMSWDTLWYGEGSTIGRLISGDLPGARGQGMACISNFGNWAFV